MRRRNRVAWAAKGFVACYSAAVLAWVVVWRLLGDATWWLVLINRFSAFLFVPAPLLLLWGIRTRRARWLAVSSVPLAVYGALYWPYAFPRLAVPPAGSTALRVMTFNILYSEHRYDGIARMINAYKPALVALQEVQPEAYAALRAALQAEYPYSRLGAPHPYGTTAVFSRYAIRDSYQIDLGADRPAVALRLSVGDHTITFISAHLFAYNLDYGAFGKLPRAVYGRIHAQNEQARRLVDEAIHSDDQVVILGCDCNGQETTSTYAILREAMTNAAREAGWRVGAPIPAGTHPDRDPLHIDYVFYRGPVQVKGVYAVKDSVGSDHQPVIADLFLR